MKNIAKDDHISASSDSLGVDCQDEIEKMVKAECSSLEFIIKMEEGEEIATEEKMDSNNYLNNSVSSTQSVLEDPLYLKEEEEESPEVKIEEDRPSQNISGQTLKIVQQDQNIPERTSHLPTQNLVKSMFNQAEAAKLDRSFSTKHLRLILNQKRNSGSSHVARLIRSQNITPSIQEDPLHLYSKEDKELRKIEEDRPCQNTSGPSIKYVQNKWPNLTIRRPSRLPVHKSRKKMLNQADPLAFSTVPLEKKVTPSSLHDAKLRSPKLPGSKAVLVTKSHPEPPCIKSGTSILKSNSKQPSINIYATSARDPITHNHNEKVRRDKLNKDLDKLRDKLAHIWHMNDVPTVTVLERARDYCVFLQQQETQLKIDQQAEEVRNSCLKRRLETLTCDLSSMTVEEVPWEEIK